MRAKRSLSQNFLTNPTIAVRIADAVAAPLVIEIGPGKGMLTEKLLDHASVLLAVEKDDQLICVLRERFRDAIASKRLVLIHGDVLDSNFADYASGDYTVVGNIPYNITGALIRHIFSQNVLPTRIVLMVQKEVAERIVTRNKKESILSLSVKAYGTPRILCTVASANFSPQPKVDSAVVVIDSVSRSNFSFVTEAHFFFCIRAGFHMKRKTVFNNLVFAGYDKENVEFALKEAKINTQARPETIRLEEWLIILRYLNPHTNS